MIAAGHVARRTNRCGMTIRVHAVSDGDEITIRRSRQADVPAVLLLWRIAAVGQSVSDDEHSGRRLIDHGPNSLLLAEVHGEVVGSLTGWAAAGYAAELEWVRGVRMLWRRRLSRRSGGGQRNARDAGMVDDVAMPGVPGLGGCT